MEMVSGLQKKEVINLCDGCRLGYVCDLEIDLCTGKICSIVVPGEGRWLSLFGKCEDYVIPWCEIKKIGEDIILVDVGNCCNN